MISYHTCDDIVAQGYADGVRLLLYQCDNDFRPSLSSRSSLTTFGSGGQAPENGLDQYCNLLFPEKFILAVDDEMGVPVGIMVYRENYVPNVVVLDEGSSGAIYVICLAIMPGYRRMGIARRLYQTLLGLDICIGRELILRTWSSNRAHIRLLESLEFRESCRLLNDRGRGLDTSYFKKHV